MSSTDEAVRELRGLLPHVSESMITHFLSKTHTVEECYEKLREATHQTPTSPPEDRQYAFAPVHTDTNASHSFRRGVSYPTPIPHQNELYRAQNSDSQAATHQWRRESNESPSYRQAPPSPRPDRLSSSEFTGATGLGRISPSPLTELITAQREGLDRLMKLRDHHVSELSKLKAQILQTKEELSELRVKVSEEKRYEEEMETDNDVIKTLRFDINEKMKQISILKSQVEMKASRDVYTEEGVRWQCATCGFLNHPLLPSCEQCSRRSSR